MRGGQAGVDPRIKKKVAKYAVSYYLVIFSSMLLAAGNYYHLMLFWFVSFLVYDIEQLLVLRGNRISLPCIRTMSRSGLDDVTSKLNISPGLTF